MRFCQEHWDKLRQAIDDRGLSHLVARDGAAAAERIRAELDGTADKRTYDPLMAAHWMIMGWALEQAGASRFPLLNRSEVYHILASEDFCPVCEGMRRVVNRTPEQTEHELMNGPSDEVLKYCRDAGLVGGEA